MFRAAVLACALALAPVGAHAMDFFARTNPQTLPAELGDLPLVTVEPAGATHDPRFVIWLSGDGGWSVLERETTGALARAGVPTVGVNALRYYWRRRKPEETARTIDRMVRVFSERWGRARFVLVGFSFGAD